jgi:hypothetical protein
VIQSRHASIRTFGRVALWLGSVLVSVTAFTLLICLRFGSGAAFLIFRLTLVFALPVACLSLPFVLRLKRRDDRKNILITAPVIGPVSMFIWGLILQLAGGDSHNIWFGDPLIGVGGIAAIIFSAVVGFLAGFFYVAGLGFLDRRSTAD